MSWLEFIKDKISYLTALVCADGFAGLFLWIIGVKPVFIMLLMIMWICPFCVAFFLEYYKKHRYYKQLDQAVHVLDEKTLLSEMMPEADFAEGRRLQSILEVTDLYANDRIAAYQKEARSYKEYIEMWVHEIKTPITAAKLLISSHKDVWTKQLDIDIDRVDGYVEQVLYYARSTSLEKDFFVKRVTLQEMVSDTLKACAPEMIRAGVSVQLQQLEFYVNADPKWMQFILRQLISNSIKYCGEKPPVIRFEGIEEKNRICLNIRDYGIGIAQSDLARIFEKGFTGQNGRSTARSTGMGLYLCKRLCEKMNIQIQAESENGTCITIIFPCNSMIEEILPERNITKL